jgi:glyoxalase family protein
MSRPPTQGLHHVTAMAADAQANVDFYTRLLGCNLVKATVNFDAPSVWHFYYGDAAGSPGSVISHFPLADPAPGQAGTGAAAAVAYAVAPAALPGWMARLEQAGVAAQREERLGEAVIGFADADGMRLELVGRVGARDVPERLAGVTLWLAETAATAAVLTGVLGLQETGRAGDRTRFAAPDGSTVDLLARPDSARARPGAGSIHHIAFRAADLDDLGRWRERVAKAGLGVTEVRDRQYFRSIYFREPGGVLVEIATDDPGFATDEAAGQLGRRLMLPAWLERHRPEIARRLPPVRRPDGVVLP